MESVRGRLVLEDRVAAGRVLIENDVIVAIELGPEDASGPFVLPGFIDVHVHGWGGHDAMAGRSALDGMARALLRQGVTSFLPTALTAPLADLAAFAAEVRGWLPDAPADGASPLGFNLEGPFLAPARRGMHDASLLLVPANVKRGDLEPLLDGLRCVTVAPELPGALELVAWLAGRGVVVSTGHSDADLSAARAGYAAGATSTTHLFNAMSGFDHRSPGLAVAALANDEVYVELIADGVHVDPQIWPIVARVKPVDRLVLVSDAIAFGGTDVRHGTIGGITVEIKGARCSVVESGVLAGSVTALGEALRKIVQAGIPLPAASAAASRNPAEMLGLGDRGRLLPGQRADVLELDDDLRVQRVMAAGVWQPRLPGR